MITKWMGIIALLAWLSRFSRGKKQKRGCSGYTATPLVIWWS